MDRPSTRELFNKIEQAKTAANNSKVLIIDPAAIASDAIELGYQIKKISKVLSIVLNEITPQNYVGYHPPQRAYKPEISGLELFAFRWLSKSFGCHTYLKFCLKKEDMYLVSFHQHRQVEGGGP